MSAIKRLTIDRTTVSNWFVAIATVAIAGTGIGQCSIYGRQLDTMRLQQRAWLTVTNVALSKMPSAAGDEIVAWVTLENTGSTPAIHVRQKSLLQFGNPRRTPDAEEGPVSIGTQKELATIPLVASKGRLRFPTNVFTVPASTNQSVWVRLRIQYVDVFHCEHWLQVCRAYSDGSPANDLGYCERSDDIDTDQMCRPEQQ